MLRQKLACSRNRSFVRWISVVHMETGPLMPLWPNPRPLLETLETSLAKSPNRRVRSNQTPRAQRTARLLTRKLGEKRKGSDVLIKVEIGKARSPLRPPVPTLPAAPAGTCPKSPASTATRRDTTQVLVGSPRRTPQKTSIGLGNLRASD